MDLSIKVTELEAAQNDISQYREQNGTLELQISRLQSQLSDSSLYKEWYEAKQKECDEV